MKKKLIIISCLLPFLTNLWAQPAISGFSPLSGPVGTVVTVTGTNLGSPTAYPTAFTIGGVSAVVVSDNGTNLVGLVMPGATSGAVSVTTAGGGPATGASNFTVTADVYPSAQLGSKLVGTGYSGTPNQGYQVALSADGTTALVGGDENASYAGAVWVYTRNGTTWTQQTEIVANGTSGSGITTGTGESGGGRFGISVALSADGNTALIGGYEDNGDVGAAWVFTRNGTTWTQQGAKLTGTGTAPNGNGELGYGYFGKAVSLSADGNTALIGAYADNDSTGHTIGAAWVFTRSGGVWTQYGAKLVGSGYTVTPLQGWSVALSNDGSTALIGGYENSGEAGAAWVFVNGSPNWTQQGGALIGTGAVSGAWQGWSVALSADGNTAAVAGKQDSDVTGGLIGAVWIYTRNGSTWTQQGSKLVPEGRGPATTADQMWFGASVSLSADGNTLVVGAPDANNSNGTNYKGAIWVFTRSGGVWSQVANNITPTDATGNSNSTIGDAGVGISLSADGTTALVGGNGDAADIGAAWLYTANPGPVANFSAGNTIVCRGSTVNFADQSTGAPDSWLWTFAGGTPDTSTSQNPAITYNDTGTFSVKLVVSNLSGTDSLTKSGYITVVEMPSTGILSAAPDTLCAGSSSQLTATGSTGTRQWQSSSSGGNYSNISGADSAVYNTPPLSQTAGYRLIVSIGSCSDTSAALPLVVNPAPVPPTLSTKDSLICSSDSSLISTSGSYTSYLWNNGDTAPFTYAHLAGGYWVTVTDANGCTAVSGHVNIAVYPVPSVSILVSGDTLSSYGAVAYQWYDNGIAIPGDTSSFYVATQGGSYSVEITDSNGCNALSNNVVIAAVNDLSEPLNVAILPNPSAEGWQLLTDGHLTGSQVEIYEANGRIIYRSEIRTTKTYIDLNVPPGVYWLRIGAGDIVITRKLVKL